MDMVISKLTVLFEDPFWILLYERSCGKKFEVAKVTFGAEPKDYEVFDFLLKNYRNLRFSPSLETSPHKEQKINPKRLRRKINRELQITTIGTKAQMALKLLQEQSKVCRKTTSRQEREKKKERQFELSQNKRREKHKGH